jgi:hypothetical protein
VAATQLLPASALSGSETHILVVPVNAGGQATLSGNVAAAVTALAAPLAAITAPLNSAQSGLVRVTGTAQGGGFSRYELKLLDYTGATVLSLSSAAAVTAGFLGSFDLSGQSAGVYQLQLKTFNGSDALLGQASTWVSKGRVQYLGTLAMAPLSGSPTASAYLGDGRLAVVLPGQPKRIQAYGGAAWRTLADLDKPVLALAPSASGGVWAVMGASWTELSGTGAVLQTLQATQSLPAPVAAVVLTGTAKVWLLRGAADHQYLEAYALGSGGDASVHFDLPGFNAEKLMPWDQSLAVQQAGGGSLWVLAPDAANVQKVFRPSGYALNGAAWLPQGQGRGAVLGPQGYAGLKFADARGQQCWSFSALPGSSDRQILGAAADGTVALWDNTQQVVHQLRLNLDLPYAKIVSPPSGPQASAFSVSGSASFAGTGSYALYQNGVTLSASGSSLAAGNLGSGVPLAISGPSGAQSLMLAVSDSTGALSTDQRWISGGTLAFAGSLDLPSSLIPTDFLFDGGKAWTGAWDKGRLLRWDPETGLLEKEALRVDTAYGQTLALFDGKVAGLNLVEMTVQAPLHLADTGGIFAESSGLEGMQLRASSGLVELSGKLLGNYTQVAGTGFASAWVRYAPGNTAELKTGSSYNDLAVSSGGRIYAAGREATELDPSVFPPALKTQAAVDHIGVSTGVRSVAVGQSGRVYALDGEGQVGVYDADLHYIGKAAFSDDAMALKPQGSGMLLGDVDLSYGAAPRMRVWKEDSSGPWLAFVDPSRYSVRFFKLNLAALDTTGQDIVPVATVALSDDSYRSVSGTYGVHGDLAGSGIGAWNLTQSLYTESGTGSPVTLAAGSGELGSAVTLGTGNLSTATAGIYGVKLWTALSDSSARTLNAYVSKGEFSLAGWLGVNVMNYYSLSKAGMAWNPAAGEFYLAYNVSNQWLACSATGQVLRSFSWEGGEELSMGSDGRLWAAGGSGGRAYNPQSGVVEIRLADGAGINAIDASGSGVLCTNATAYLSEYGHDGHLIRKMDSGTSSHFTHIAHGPAGTFFACDSGTLDAFDPQGKRVWTVSVSGGITDLAWGNDGLLWVATSSGPPLTFLPTGEQYRSIPPGPGSGGHFRTSLAAGPDDRMAVLQLAYNENTSIAVYHSQPQLPWAAISADGLQNGSSLDAVISAQHPDVAAWTLERGKPGIPESYSTVDSGSAATLSHTVSAAALPADGVYELRLRAVLASGQTVSAQAYVSRGAFEYRAGAGPATGAGFAAVRVQPSTGHVFAAPLGQASLFEYDALGARVADLALPSKALDLDFDAAGSLYVLTDDKVLRRYAAPSAGSLGSVLASFPLMDPSRVRSAPGKIMVLDQGLVRCLDPDSLAPTATAWAHRLDPAWVDMAVDTVNSRVALASSTKVQWVSLAGQDQNTWTRAGLKAIAYDGSRGLLLGSLGTQILAMNASSGVTKGASEGSGSVPGKFLQAYSLGMSPAGDLWVADQGALFLQALRPSVTAIKESSAIEWPRGITVDRYTTVQGTAVMADMTGYELTVGQSASPTSFVLAGSGSSPVNHGTLGTLDLPNDGVYLMRLSATAADGRQLIDEAYVSRGLFRFVTESAQPQGGFGVAGLSDGSRMVAQGNTVRRYSAEGVLQATCSIPNNGTLYDLEPEPGTDNVLVLFAGGSSDAIYRVSPAGAVQTISNTGSSPVDMAFGADGKLWVAGYSPARLTRLPDGTVFNLSLAPRAVASVDANTLALVVEDGSERKLAFFDLAGGGLQTPFEVGAAARNLGHMLWLNSGVGLVVSTDADQVLAFNSSGTVLATLGGTGDSAGQFRYPTGLSAAGTGSFWVGEANGAHRIQRFDSLIGAAATPTPSSTATPSRTATASPTATPTASPSSTATPTASASPSSTDSPTASGTPTASPSSTPTPTASASPSSTISPTDSDTKTSSPSPSITPTFTVTMTATRTAVPTSVCPIVPAASFDGAGDIAMHMGTNFRYLRMNPATRVFHIFGGAFSTASTSMAVMPMQPDTMLITYGVNGSISYANIREFADTSSETDWAGNTGYAFQGGAFHPATHDFWVLTSAGKALRYIYDPAHPVGDDPYGYYQVFNTKVSGSTFNSTGEVAFDRSGNLYAPSGTSLVKLSAEALEAATAAGNGTDLAGTAASSGGYALSSVVCDGNGSVFVIGLAGAGYSHVLKYSIAGNSFSVLATTLAPAVTGSGNELGQSGSMVLGTDGYLWMAQARASDPGNAGLAQIDPVTGQTLQLVHVPSTVDGVSVSLDIRHMAVLGLPLPYQGCPALTATNTPSPTFTATPSQTGTPTRTPTPSPSATPSPTATPSQTNVPPGSTLTNTPSNSPTLTVSASSTATPTPTSTITLTSSITPTPTITPTLNACTAACNAMVCENFESYSNGATSVSGWTFSYEGGTGASKVSATGHVLNGKALNLIADSSSHAARAMASDPSVQNLTNTVLRARVKYNSNVETVMMLRVHDTGAGLWAGSWCSNCFAMHVYANGNINLFRMISGSYSHLADATDTFPSGISSGDAINVEFRAEGTALKGYVNGKLVVSTTNSSHTSGGVAIASLNSGWWDEIKIDPVDCDWTFTPTVTPTFTRTPTGTISPTFSQSPTPTMTPTITQTSTASATFTPTPSPTQTPSPTASFTPCAGEDCGAHAGGAKEVASSTRMPDGVDLLIAPNPLTVQSIAFFRLHHAAGKVRLTLVDLAGSVVQSQVLGSHPAGVYRQEWPVQSLPPGIYLIALESDEGIGYKTRGVFKVAVVPAR